VTTGAAASELPVSAVHSDKLNRPRSIGRLLLASGGARLIVLPVTGISHLVIARLITSAAGLDQFGVVMLVATLSQPLMFADLGAGAAVATARAQVPDAGAEQFRRKTLTAIRATLCSAALLGVAAVVLGLLHAWPNLLGVHSAQYGKGLDIAAVLVLLTFAVGLPFSLSAHILRGSGRMHQAVLLAGLSTPVALGLTALLVSLHAPPLAFALPIPIGGLLSFVWGAIVLRRYDADIVRGLVRQVFRPRRFRGLPISAIAAPWVVVTMGLPLALQSDRIVLSHRIALDGLANYSYAAQLYLPIESVVMVAALALWPHFAVENQRAATLRKTWLTGLAILGSAGSFAAIGFVVLSPYVIQWMSAEAATPPQSLLLAFGALLIVQSLHATTAIMLISPKGLRFQAVCMVALVVTNLPLSWILAPILGPSGPVVASALTMAACQLVPGIIVANRATSKKSAVEVN
jgi:O-antigen/teichoic acid export membrane protein